MGVSLWESSSTRCYVHWVLRADQLSKQKTDKRKRNDDQQEVKRQRVDRGDAPLPIYATKFSEEELKAEDRKPKKKVAVMIGYSGTGYRGMQLTHDQKTIEGDLFQAFVAAGAISKANADDPKKSSFVRCARTDKGVHAAGNIISLKLIVEDEDIVKKINEALNPQIRVWGFERTNNSFSAYQLCDSRIYEYLIPTHSFLPPHPSSFLGRRIKEFAEQKNDLEGLQKRQAEVEGFWEKIDQETINPILDAMDARTRAICEKAVFLRDEVPDEFNHRLHPAGESSLPDAFVGDLEDVPPASSKDTAEMVSGLEPEVGPEATSEAVDFEESKEKKTSPVAEGIRKLRSAYVDAKRSYRIPDARLRRVISTLKIYEGTRNFHNYTVQKQFRDPSAKRVIKSFIVNPKPILINGTEWLSLKVHGQSFMMHQIRKMVGMVALVVRCGTDPRIIEESYGPVNLSIPKAPSLGLLLERPIFDSYNKRAKGDLGKEIIDFDKFKKEMDDFKQREIYERMYRDEEKDNVFGNFFNHVDNFPAETFLFVTSGGVEATKTKIEGGAGRAQQKAMVDDEDDEDGGVGVKDEAGDEG
jgi:tRNA pseudouridine38-40 synthase